jgi:hypothetical protein
LLAQDPESVERYATSGHSWSAGLSALRIKKPK